MKAMVCESYGGPEVLALRDVPDPTPPGPDENSGANRHTIDACAELGNARAALCDKVPDGMSIEHAGVFRSAYATAYHALLQRGRMVAGEWVLVHGAAGGIGIAAIQMAKLFGARVIATASTDAKRAACLEEGADHAANLKLD